MKFLQIFHLVKCIYVDLQNFWVTEAPQATIPISILTTPYQPDIVIFNSQISSIALLELTCPLDSVHHIQSARSWKQFKVKYLQLLAEFDHLKILSYYKTVEITLLGHYQPASVNNLMNLINFSCPGTTTSKSLVRKMLDAAACKSISSSQRIFLERTCKEWVASANLT